MSVLWTAAAAAAATGGTSRGDWRAAGISIDTRTLQAGDLFVALRDVRDGHEFVATALANGAAAALVSRLPDDVAPDAPLLVVDDVLAALCALGAAARARSAARVIAITGSVGKTSTKDMLAHVLKSQGRVHAAEMSLNNHWGVPLTLARMPSDSDFAVIEIGMNHPGEIAPLAGLVRPHVAVITTVAEAHMEAFASVGDIARAKAEIFAGLDSDGVAILNDDDATFGIVAGEAVAHKARIVRFGTAETADFRLVSAQAQIGMMAVQASIDGETTLFRVGAPGQHLAMNALAALAVVGEVDADIALAMLDLANWHPPAGRGARQWIALDPVEPNLRLELIDDAYNANPASMAAAFEVLANATPVDGIGRIHPGRRIAFLSDMLELGLDAAARHAALASLTSMQAVDRVHLAGPLMHHLHAALPVGKRGEWHESAEALAATAHRLLDAGDVVMVKGSKGSRASLVVDAILKLDKANAK